MKTSYIEAFERIRLGVDDKRILSYGKGDNIAKVSKDWCERRVMELKSIIQSNHPDKPSGDIVKFRAAKEELARLRNGQA